MKFSTKSRYALRLMAELARYAPGTTVSLKEISERQNLSLKYLEPPGIARRGLFLIVRAAPHSCADTAAPRPATPLYPHSHFSPATPPAGAPSR